MKKFLFFSISFFMTVGLFGQAKIMTDNSASSKNTQLIKEHKLSVTAKTITPACSFNGRIQTGDFSSSNRPFLNGQENTCLAPKPFPGVNASGPFLYDFYNYTNTSAASECVTVYYGGIQEFVSSYAYQQCYDATNLTNNFLASSGFAVVGGELSYSFNLAPGARAVIIVYNFQSGKQTDYTLQIEGAGTCGVASPNFLVCPGNQVRNTNAGACNWMSPNNDLNPVVNVCGLNTLTYQLTGATAGSGSNSLNGVVFNKGITSITWTAQASFGNNASCTFDLNVVDNELPIINCQSNVELNPTTLAGTVYNFIAPVGLDNCTGATTIQTAGLPSGSVYPIGTTINTFEVTDASGNKAICSFTVKVKDPYSGPKKVFVCHNGNTLNISVNAVQAHLDHGDKLGPCSFYSRLSKPAGIVLYMEQVSKVYPSPSKGEINVQLSSAISGKVELQLMDGYGKIVATKNVAKANGQTERFDVRAKGSGLYFIKVISSEQIENLQVAVQQ